ncbi:MAG: DUF3617 family protein [Bradyrhizobiaceae bacterium]|nr:DUF3617 family protein [Bradyrhizobiaceae bacterium]
MLKLFRGRLRRRADRTLAAWRGRDRGRRWCALSVCALFLVSSAVPARAADPQPGLWQISSKSERGNVTVGERSATSCLTPEQAKELTQPSVDPALDARNECKVVDSRRTRDGLISHIQCSGAVPVESKTEYVFNSADRYSAVMTTTLTVVRKSLTSTLRIEAQRIGDCPR